MKEFTIKYNMKLKNNNIELEFKVSNEEEFKTTIEKLKEEYIPFISNIKNEPSKSKNNISKKKSNIYNNDKKKDNKNQKGGYKRVKLNLNDKLDKDLDDFYNFHIKNGNLQPYKKILLLLYWLKDNDIGEKIDKHIIYSILYKVGDKVDFNIENTIHNCKRLGKAYIDYDKEKGFYIATQGIKKIEDILNNKENA